MFERNYLHPYWLRAVTQPGCCGNFRTFLDFFTILNIGFFLASAARTILPGWIFSDLEKRVHRILDFRGWFSGTWVIVEAVFMRGCKLSAGFTCVGDTSRIFTASWLAIEWWKIWGKTIDVATFKLVIIIK